MSFPSFSSLIDVSSFFIGVLINLLLVALICYYFKKKFDNIEIAQSEQAKILHGLIEERMEQKTVEQKSSGLNFFTMADLERMNNDTVTETKVEEDVSNDSKQIMLTSEEHAENVNDESSLSDSESEDEEESESESEADEEEIKQVEIVEEETHYEKMTAKELKELITDRGVNVKKYMKKQEMIDMLTEMDNKEQEVHIVKEEVVEEEHEVILEPVDGGFDLSHTEQEEVVENVVEVEQQDSVEDELSLGEVVLETSAPDVELE